MTATATKQARTLVSRAVIWAGLALGTFLTVLTVMNGIRVPRLEVVLSVITTWTLLTVLAVVAVELLRRHHRAIGRHGWRYGKRGTIATVGWAGAMARSAATRSLPCRTRFMAAVQARWAVRNAPATPAEPDGPSAVPAPEPGPEDGQPGKDEPRPSWSWGLAGARAHWPAASLEEAQQWARQMSTDGRAREVAEYPPGGGPGKTVATYVNGKPEKGNDMTASRIGTQHRARRAARTGTTDVPSEWAPVIAGTADFEPENDGELLEWMARQVTGLSGWAEALVDTYEHCTQVIGIDPQASAMLHDVADAAAQAAETMAAAKARFTEHYELPREFAANGGLMTHDGRWVTGEGA
jgi:hypothetical protein